MKIIKRAARDIPKEEAHGGSGARKVYASPDHLKSSAFEAMTHGFLPAGGTFDWHDHVDIEEIMVVVKGRGEIHDEDGVYEYEPGDVFVYPANVKYKIHNPTNEEHEMIFVRVKV
jgi:mannose-6-phosphate isomerase-like protein (cupin superfamily)